MNVFVPKVISPREITFYFLTTNTAAIILVCIWKVRNKYVQWEQDRQRQCSVDTVNGHLSCLMLFLNSNHWSCNALLPTKHHHSFQCHALHFFLFRKIVYNIFSFLKMASLIMVRLFFWHRDSNHWWDLFSCKRLCPGRISRVRSQWTIALTTEMNGGLWIGGSPVAWCYQKWVRASFFMKLVVWLGDQEFSSSFNTPTTMNSLGYLNCDPGYQE